MIIFLLILSQMNPVLRYYHHKFDSTGLVQKGAFASLNYEKDTISWFFIDFGEKLRLSKSWRIDLKVRFKNGNESVYPFYIWHGIGSMDYRKALLQFSKKDFSVDIGVDAPKLSQGYFTTLFFTGEEPGFSQIKFYFSKGRFRFEFLTGQMKELKTSPFWQIPSTKYFSFHKLIYRVQRNLEVSFSEAALFKSFEDNTVDWYLLNPFVLWYPRQANYGKTDLNALWLFSFNWRTSNSSFLYGDFMIDDTPYKRENDENPRVGGLMGYRMEKGNWLSILEASFVTRYTYSYYPDRLYLSWFFNNFPLGTLTGTDFVKISAFTEHSSSLFAYMEILLQGEGKIGEPFEIGHLSRKVLLSGDVNKVFRVSAGIKRNVTGLKVILAPGIIYNGTLSGAFCFSISKIARL